MFVRTCGEIIHHGSGDRYSHTYCDWLPKDHDGPHIPHPTAGQLRDAWSADLRKELAQHQQVPTSHPNDTKQVCACGEQFVSRCELALHIIEVRPK